MAKKSEAKRSEHSSYFFASDFFAFGRSSFQRRKRDRLHIDVHPGNRVQVDMGQ
jgi:hypothetical protein